mgnify:CR=1 FL=1
MKKAYRLAGWAIPAQWLIVFILILYARIRIRHAAADAAKRPLHPAERDRSASG